MFSPSEGRRRPETDRAHQRPRARSARSRSGLLCHRIGAVHALIVPGSVALPAGRSSMAARPFNPDQGGRQVGHIASAQPTGPRAASCIRARTAKCAIRRLRPSPTFANSEGFSHAEGRLSGCDTPSILDERSTGIQRPRSKVSTQDCCSRVAVVTYCGGLGGYTAAIADTGTFYQELGLAGPGFAGRMLRHKPLFVPGAELSDLHSARQFDGRVGHQLIEHILRD
jgi:hypothetical protein